MRTVSIGLACMLAACGGADAAPDEGAAKPSSGAEAPSARTEIRRELAPARVASPGDLDVEVQGETPAGALLPENARDYAVQVLIRNRRDEPLEMGDTFGTVAVYRGPDLVEGCGGSRTQLEVPPVLGPRASVRASLALPCALPEAGEYDVVVLVAPNADDDVIAPDETRRSVAMRLTVDEPTRDLVPPAEVHPPAPSATLPVPRPLDVRPATPAP
ncbi:hypothetical protein [Sandaracinus amylolyticus]|uniref:Lipoprotein n=1 Tax=Sandaracinus amylolyticus TaxID=927083 RepID=A0A0F6SDX7_9BACT|nr:hypothetical protein [Sandaracinus amylolyticus]AKF04214.1 hypothetical protein DB32_001363 [Sandaracinus amylolyticus]